MFGVAIFDFYYSQKLININNIRLPVSASAGVIRSDDTLVYIPYNDYNQPHDQGLGLSVFWLITYISMQLIEHRDHNKIR